MTVETEVSEIDFAGTGLVTTFPVPFPIQAEEQLVVTLLLDGDTIPFTELLGIHYTISEVGEPTCVVEMLAAPPADSVLHVERTVEIIQPTSLRTAGAFTAKSHEDALDYRTYVDQELERRIAALELQGALVPSSSFDAQLVDVDIETLDPVEDTFPLAPIAVALPAGATDITGILVSRVTVEADESWEAIQVREWSYDPEMGSLILNRVTGLSPLTAYTLTLLVLTLEPV